MQWTLLNVITLGHTETDNINQMKTLKGYFYSHKLLYLLNGTYEI